MTFRVESEVGTLRKVLLYRPGLELRRLVSFSGSELGRDHRGSRPSPRERA